MNDSHWQTVAQCCNILELISLRRVSKSVAAVSRLKLSWKYCSLVVSDERRFWHQRIPVERGERSVPYPKFCLLALPHFIRICPQLQSVSFQMTDPAKRAECIWARESFWEQVRGALVTHKQLIRSLSWVQYEARIIRISKVC